MFGKPPVPRAGRGKARAEPLIDYSTAVKAYREVYGAKPEEKWAPPTAPAPMVREAWGVYDEGHQGSDWERGRTVDMSQNGTHIRNVVNRFGEMMAESYNIPLPKQEWRIEAEALLPRAFRDPPTKRLVVPGVPGYMGHIPHGTMGRADGTYKPHTEQFEARSWNTRKALDQSHYPKKMPPPGYGGHLPQTKTSVDAYGTSRWAPREAPDRSPRVMSEGRYPPTTGWPTCSAGLMFDATDGPNKKSIDEIIAHNAKTVASLGNF